MTCKHCGGPLALTYTEFCHKTCEEAFKRGEFERLRERQRAESRGEESTGDDQSKAAPAIPPGHREVVYLGHRFIVPDGHYVTYLDGEFLICRVETPTPFSAA